jgi:1-acyl-sn-glycerol-3-phosphate acyltransferase
MTRLQAAIEDRTAELVAEATGRPVTPSIFGVPADEAKRAAKAVSSPVAQPAEE